MGLNKKGIFFMMLTIILLSLFLISSTFLSAYAMRKSVQKRVESLSDFVSETEEDLERQIFVFGFRTIFLIQGKIVDTGQPSSSVRDIFQEAFFNQTINDEIQPLLIDASFVDIVERIQNRAGIVSANVSFSNPIINITQDDPWNLKVTFTSDFFVEDGNHLASWNKTLVSTTYISIENFTDPVYTRETNNEWNPYIVRTPFTNFTLDNLTDQVENTYYKEHVGAPSFIDRLEGNFDPPGDGANGIESLVYLPNPVLGGSLDKSVVDYIYFSSLDPVDTCQIVGMPSWFRLDPGHTGEYGAVCVE